jgi:hypothetical protein
MFSWLSGALGLSPRRFVAFSCLDQHPNRVEIRAIMARVPSLSNRELSRLAYGWRDNSFLASARDHALSPAAPLILEVLTAFDQIDAAIFDGDPDTALLGETLEEDPASAHGLGTALKPQLANAAVKAIRDALAAAYARPVLTRSEYVALMGPWRRLIPTPR